jgi:hypothetical protein
MEAASNHLGRVATEKKQSYLLLQVMERDWIMSLGLFGAFLRCFLCCFIILFLVVFSLIKMLSDSAA